MDGASYGHWQGIEDVAEGHHWAPWVAGWVGHAYLVVVGLDEEDHYGA